MEIHFLPFKDGVIVYRPLARLAFVGNHAMGKLAGRLAHDPDADVSPKEEAAVQFLRSIGFLEPDPEPPTSPGPDSPFRPTTAVICLTTKCNLRCVYCYARGGEAPALTLAPGLGRRVIQAVCENAQDTGQARFDLVFHGGGEPTMALDGMRQLTAYARSRSLPCHVSISTNGCWSQEATGWLLENMDEISLSLDGLAPAQNRQRPASDGSSSFERALTAIGALDRRGLPYGIRMTVVDDSIAELPDAVEWLCRETGCRTFQVEPAFAQGRASRVGCSLTSRHLFAAAFLRAYDMASAHGRHLYYSGARPWLVTSRFCQAIDRALVVTPSGAVTACYEICDPEHPLAARFGFGHVGRDGIVVEGVVRSVLQERIEERRSLCRGCFCYRHCAGDCPSKTLTPDGESDLRFGERCELNRTLTQELLVRFIEAGGGVWKGDGGRGSENTPLW